MATVFTLAGTFGSPAQILPMLGGTITAVTTNNTVISVPYPNWGFGSTSELEQGAEALNAQLLSTPGPMIVMGHTLGAVVASYWLANYGPTSSVSPSDVSFVLLANPNRPYGGYYYSIGWFQNVATIPLNTPYTVTDFARQYDGYADWPQYSAMQAAGTNAVAGQGIITPSYQNVTLALPTNASYVVGNVTYMWSVTWPAPILGTIQSPNSATQDADIRPTIEAAYNRPCALSAPLYTPLGIMP